MKGVSYHIYRIVAAMALLWGAMAPGAAFGQEDNPIDAYNSVKNASVVLPGENIDEKISKNFFLKAEVSKTECFVGEMVMATFKAYSRLDASSEVLSRPSFSGFSVMEMVDVYSSQPDVEKYDGQYYFVHLIRKVQLFALQPGTFTLEPAEVQSVIHLRRASEPSLAEDVIRSRGRQRQYEMDRRVTSKTPPVTIHVKSLPEKDRPEDFAGAVGDFHIELSSRDSVIHSGEGAKIRLSIVGTGNLPIVTDPEVQWPENITASLPVVRENLNKYAYPLSGSKVFEYNVRAPDTGLYIIPHVSLSYFDPSEASYKRTESDSIHFIVQARNTEPVPTVAIPLRRGDGSLPWAYLLPGAALLLAIGIWFMLRKKKAAKKT